MLNMKIKIKAPQPKLIKFYTILNFSFIILEYQTFTFFLKLPISTQFSRKNNYFFFFLKKYKPLAIFNIRAFYLKLITFLRKQQPFFCKKLLLKGLGFKVMSLIPNDFLELKIGYSHYVKITLSKSDNIKIYYNKNMIVIEGSSLTKVGNFANKIKNFRLPDSYKGKGIWYKNEIKVLKEIKKT